MAALVVSYARVDQPLIRAVIRLLRGALGGITEVFWDDDFQPGQAWFKQFEEAVDSTPQLFVFWCYHAAQSEQVDREIRYAIARGAKVVPVLLDDVLPNPPLCDIQAIDLRGVTSHQRLVTLDGTWARDDTRLRRVPKHDTVQPVIVDQPERVPGDETHELYMPAAPIDVYEREPVAAEPAEAEYGVVGLTDQPADTGDGVVELADEPGDAVEGVVELTDKPAGVAMRDVYADKPGGLFIGADATICFSRAAQSGASPYAEDDPLREALVRAFQPYFTE